LGSNHTDAAPTFHGFDSSCSRRENSIDSLNEIIVGPVTRTIRGLDTEVVLTTDDGMPVACALSFEIKAGTSVGGAVPVRPSKKERRDVDPAPPRSMSRCGRDAPRRMMK
jgi:hypothetical protein